MLAQAQQLKASLLALLSLGQIKPLVHLPTSATLETITTTTINQLEQQQQQSTGRDYGNARVATVANVKKDSLVLLMKQQQTDNGNYKYAVVVDCGSSGTRAHIFRWPAETSVEDLPNRLRPMRDPSTGRPMIERIQPGLSSIKDTPELASDYMKPIMDFATLHVPRGTQRETPIYFLGTAGLRLLPMKTQESILNDIARDLKVEYNFPNIYSKVISGVSEGVYQWLSINAYSNRLNSRYDLEQSSPVLAFKDFFCQSSRARRLGMLEIGGASAQVTFETNPLLDYLLSFAFKFSPEAKRAYERSRVSFNLGPNRRFNLFSTTFLGLGTNSARSTAVDLLVRNAIGLRTANNAPPLLFRPPYYVENSTLIIEDPCLPLGGFETMIKPSELLYNQSKTIGFDDQEGQKTFQVRLLGRGNYHMCRSLLNRVIWLARQESFNCPQKEQARLSCSSSLLGTNFVLFKYFQFIGLSELFYTTNEIMRAAGPFNPHLVLKRTVQICSTTFSRLNELYPEANRVDKKRTLLECFKATWLLTWLQNGLKMPALHRIDLETLENIDGNELDWTLGALISKILQSVNDDLR